MANKDGSSSHLTDERLVQIEAAAVAHDADADSDEIANIVGELRWRRREMHKDSKMAEQLRRLRWTSELTIQKLEQLEKRLSTPDQKEPVDG